MIFLILLFYRRWEKFDNEKWSSYQPVLQLLPNINEISHPVLLSNEVLFQLFGSDVLNEITAFNTTMHKEFALCLSMVEKNKKLSSEFLSKKLLTWEHFQVFFI